MSVIIIEYSVSEPPTLPATHTVSQSESKGVRGAKERERGQLSIRARRMALRDAKRERANDPRHEGG